MFLHLVSLSLLLGLVSFLILEVFLGGIVSVFHKLFFRFQIENFSVDFVVLSEDSLELLEALESILLGLHVESESSFVLGLVFAGGFALLMVGFPGSHVRADVLGIVVSQNLVHLQLIFVSKFLIFLLSFNRLRLSSLAEHVDFKFKRTFFQGNHLQEELRVVAIELPVVGLVVNLVRSRLSGPLVIATLAIAVIVKVITLVVFVPGFVISVVIISVSVLKLLPRSVVPIVVVGLVIVSVASVPSALRSVIIISAFSFTGLI